MEVFEELIKDETQLELEKQFFGGEFYTLSFGFPSLYIVNVEEDNCYNIKSFINYIKLVDDITEVLGRSMSLIFAEACNLYEIDSENLTTDNNSVESFILSFYLQSIAYFSMANNQAKKITEKINNYDIDKELNKDLNIEISGKDYCFIVTVLSNSFSYFLNSINLISNKPNFKRKVVHDICESISLTVSDEFRFISNVFKTTECQAAMESKPTFH